MAKLDDEDELYMAKILKEKEEREKLAPKKELDKSEDGKCKLIAFGLTCDWYILVPIFVAFLAYIAWACFYIHLLLLKQNIDLQLCALQGSDGGATMSRETGARGGGRRTSAAGSTGYRGGSFHRNMVLKFGVVTELTVPENEDISSPIWKKAIEQELAELYVRATEKNSQVSATMELPELSRKKRHVTIGNITVKIVNTKRLPSNKLTVAIVYLVYEGSYDPKKDNSAKLKPANDVMTLANLLTEEELAEILGYSIVILVAKPDAIMANEAVPEIQELPSLRGGMLRRPNSNNQGSSQTDANDRDEDGVPDDIDHYVGKEVEAEEWNDWGHCLATCGPGKRRRTKMCPPSGVHVWDLDCAGISGELFELTDCSAEDCPGGWSGWGLWNEHGCNDAGCGHVKIRLRSCERPEEGCPGFPQQTASCGTPCPVNGGWTRWADSPWTSCSVTCENGVKTKLRTCTDPKPANGGADCEGLEQISAICLTGKYCQDPIPGGWGRWSGWGSCVGNCTVGFRTRTRPCNRPTPKYGAGPCTGKANDTKACSTGIDCPVDGQWSPWERGPCSVTDCSGGELLITRQCNHPPPQHGGKTCFGHDQEKEPCGICPVNGGFSEWTAFSECSETECGGGFQYSYRKCDNPPPSVDGRPCEGHTRQTRVCFAQVRECEGCKTSTFNEVYGNGDTLLPVEGKPGELAVIFPFLKVPAMSIMKNVRYYCVKSRLLYISFWLPQLEGGQSVPVADSVRFELKLKIEIECAQGFNSMENSETLGKNWLIGVHYQDYLFHGEEFSEENAANWNGALPYVRDFGTHAGGNMYTPYVLAERDATWKVNNVKTFKRSPTQFSIPLRMEFNCSIYE